MPSREKGEPVLRLAGGSERKKLINDLIAPISKKPDSSSGFDFFTASECRLFEALLSSSAP
jgi:hypothetical protein